MPDAAITAHEQLMLELVNRARLDPLAEALRLGASNVAALGLPGASLAPLAGNAQLALSSAVHSEWMLATDTFSHTGANGSSAGDRMEAAGYVFAGSWTWGENLAYRTSGGTMNVTQAVLDLHRALFFSDGHRANILSGNFRELGIGQEFGSFRGANATTITQNYARSGPDLFLTGVVYDDLNGDAFYTVGEGRGGTVIATATGMATSAGPGGYAATMTGGAQTVTITTPLGVQSVIRLDSVTGNVKLDIVDNAVVMVSASASLISGLTSLRALGTADLALTGNDAANLLTGNSGNNRFDVGAGNDTVIGGGGTDTAVIRGAAAQLSVNVDGARVTIAGPDGTDTYIGMTYFDLDGQQLDLAGLVAAIASADQPATAGWPTGGITGTLVTNLPGSLNHLSLGEDSFAAPGQADGSVGTAGDPGFADVASYADGAALHLGLLMGTSSDNRIDVGHGDHVIWAGAGNDTVHGAGGDDWILGGNGDDQIFGGDGDDLILGGDGNDTLSADAGSDTLWGGEGADVFLFSPVTDTGRVLVLDFDPGVDRIGLSGFGLSPAMLMSWLNPSTVAEAGMAGTVLGLNGREIVLLDVAPEQMTAWDFIVI